MRCTTHVHTEDSKSLPSPAHPLVWWDGLAPFAGEQGRGKEALPSDVLKGEGT